MGSRASRRPKRHAARQGQSVGNFALQAVGSSPAAWLEALAKFPERRARPTVANACATRTELGEKDLRFPALTRTEGGLVIFINFWPPNRR